MNRLFTFTLIIVATLLVSACGAPAAPTINAADVQRTAEAAAFTMVAETLAAAPTETPLPPTETPTQTAVATDTPLPSPTSPTLAVTFTSTSAPVSNATGDPCNRTLAASPRGKETVIRIVNTTRVLVKVSLYLSETAAHGECGYRGYELSRNNDVVITDLVQGCYSLLAWSDDPKEKFSSSGGGCINNPDKWTFEISPSQIKFVGP